MKSCSIVILSTDAYSDLWPACCALHRKYWSDCPWPRFLASDTKPTDFEGFGTVGVGQTGLSWSECARRILSQIESDTVLLMLDDFFLTGAVNTQRVTDLYQRMKHHRAAYLRLVPHKQYMRRLSGEQSLGEHINGLPYRSSLQAAFWDTAVLRKLLVGEENPWQFELFGGLRSDFRSEPFLSCYDLPIPYTDVLERGKWLPRGVALCQHEGLTIDFEKRSCITLADKKRRLLTRYLNWPIEMLPHGVRRLIRYYIHRKYRDSIAFAGRRKI
jgi:hypothetical protein